VKIINDLIKSEGDELKAAHDYRERAAYALSQGDTKTADLYEHIAKEEDKHYAEFTARKQEIECGGGPKPKRHKMRLIKRYKTMPTKKISIIR
jgi:rubrerythrin